MTGLIVVLGIAIVVLLATWGFADENSIPGILLLVPGILLLVASFRLKDGEEALHTSAFATFMVILGIAIIAVAYA